MMPDEHGDTFPRPDPTRLTTAALDREVARWEKELNKEIVALQKQIDGRIRLLNDRVDELKRRAIELIDETTVLIDKTAVREVSRVEERTDTALANLKEWHEADIAGLRALLEERLKTLDLRFALIEQRRLELKEDNQKALDSALDSARESVSNLAETYNTGHTNLTSQIDEVKNRLTIVEAKALGMKETTTEGRATSSMTIAMIGLGLTAAYLTVNIIVALVFHH